LESRGGVDQGARGSHGHKRREQVDGQDDGEGDAEPVYLALPGIVLAINPPPRGPGKLPNYVCEQEKVSQNECSRGHGPGHGADEDVSLELEGALDGRDGIFDRAIQIREEPTPNILGGRVELGRDTYCSMGSICAQACMGQQM